MKVVAKGYLFILLFFVIFLGKVTGSGRISETIIKVGILSGQDRIHVKCNEKFRATDIFSMDALELEPEKDYVVTVSDGGLKIGEKNTFGKIVRFYSNKKNSFIRINGRRYRDTVLATNDKGKVTVINELGLDGYLFGVLPVEVSPEWPLEALKAQAIVSRTYVLNNLGKYDSKGYDLSSDIFSQMYRGVEVENSATNRAVTETIGFVLTYEGKLAKAYFHSSCGGFTEDIKKVWGSAFKYMEGVTCPYCKDSPRYHWEVDVSPELIKQKMNAEGYNIGDVEDIKFLSRTDSGRVDDMVIKYEGGQQVLSGHRFRMAIGPNVIKSTLMSIERSRPAFHFYGRGWGHGIGMCQWGSKGMAEKGKSFNKILKFYFPHTRIDRWSY
ncbi:MAG: SpoIID/LytB domain-containing protein [Elusimicrobia bacterium]|nr:SpoIID/LytB domain-containing protein [Elusimicrobiota bacterium]